MRGAFITQLLDETHPVLGFAAGWTNALAERVEGLDVICLARGEGALAPNVGVTVLPEGRFARTRRLRSVLAQLKREHALDFVLAHMCPGYAVAATVPRRFAPTFLWYAHSSVTRMLRLANRLCDGILSCSEASYPLGGQALAVVGHGIDTDRFTLPRDARRGGPLTICCVGRITKSKRLDLLVNALARYRERVPGAAFTCRIVGPTLDAEDQEYAAILRSLIAHKELDECVRIEPALAHGAVERVYQSADVIANMTRRHSLDKATLEAMACGCLVLTTNEAFAPTLRGHAELMVKPDTSSNTLAAAIEHLAGLPEESRTDLGAALREIVVRDHSLDRMMDRIVETIAAARATRRER